jgi:putative phosphoribosyl transferase
MLNIQSFALRNREHAGLLFAEKLRRFSDSETLVIGLSNTSAETAFYLAVFLNLPFDVIPCTRIDHPANTKKSLGSITADEVVIHELAHDIPREYLSRQIAMTQRILKAQMAIYKVNPAPQVVSHTAVIVVGDILDSADAVLASIKSIKRHAPLQIVVAVPAATPQVVRQLLDEVDEVVVLTDESRAQLDNVFEEDPDMDDQAVKELFRKSMKRFSARPVLHGPRPADGSASV